MKASRFTPAITATIAECHAAGMSFPAIGVHLGWGADQASCIHQHARLKGILAAHIKSIAPKPCPNDRDQFGTQPLPAFHPLAMAALGWVS